MLTVLARTPGHKCAWDGRRLPVGAALGAENARLCAHSFDEAALKNSRVQRCAVLVELGVSHTPKVELTWGSYKVKLRVLVQLRRESRLFRKDGEHINIFSSHDHAHPLTRANRSLSWAVA